MTASRPRMQRENAEPRPSNSEPRISPARQKPAKAARQLPPLNAVHAFEAAARHQSFVQAAIELGVSAGAISRQVKLLEQNLGAELFVRHAQGVHLTAHGRRLLPVAARAFDLLEQMLPGRRERQDLRLQVSASFYLRWLLPRLPDLKRALPRLKLDLVINSGGTPGHQEVDGTIYYHRLERSVIPGSISAGPIPTGPAPAGKSDLLFDDGSILVCAPALLGRRHSPLPISSLQRFPLLLNTPDGWDWQALAQHPDLRDLSLQGAASFDIDDAAIQAALAGQGIALVERRFVTDALASGQLIEPFAVAPLCLGQYRLSWSEAARRRHDMRQLRAWFSEQAAR